MSQKKEESLAEWVRALESPISAYIGNQDMLPSKVLFVAVSRLSNLRQCWNKGGGGGGERWHGDIILWFISLQLYQFV